MKKKMYKSKKQWVIAGITSAGLILSPSVLAEESANHTTSSSVSSWVGLNQPAQLAPTSPDTAPASSETDSRMTSEPTLASTDLSVNKTQSESPASSVLSSEATSEESFVTSSDQSSSSVRSASATATHVESITDPTVSRTTSSPERASALTSAAVSSSDGDLPGAAAGNGHSEEVLVTKVVNHKTLTLTYNGPIASNEKIQYAVWGDVNGRNDITWYTADQIGAAYVDLSKHKEYGLYHVHTYKNSLGKMIGLEGGQLTVAKPWLTPKITESSPNHYVVRLEGVPSSISAVKVPVWSDKNGQDDLKWYSASQVSSGIYEAHIDTTYHNNDFGTYHIHAYGVSAITGQQIGIASTRFERVAKAVPQQSLAKVSISAKTDTTATVTVTAVEKAIKSIAVAAWSKTGGQDDLKWYQASAVNQTAQVTINMRDLSNTSDDYTIHVYTTYQDGSRVGTDLGDHRFIRPAASQTVSARLTSTGIALSVASTAVKDLSKVRVAVWSDASGQDDIKWYATDAKGEALALYGNHKSTGLYHIHAYSYETGKPVFVAKTTTTVTNLPDKTGRVNVSVVDTSNYTFKTRISDVSSRHGLRSIRVAVWSDSNGQDDIQWYTASKQNDGSYEAITHLSTHKYVNGKYHVHVYYQLNDGRMSGLTATSLNVTTPAPRAYIQRELAAIKSEYERLFGNLRGTKSLVIMPTDGTELLLINNNVQRSASTIKLFIMAAAFAKAERGELDLSQRYTVKASDIVQASVNLNGATGRTYTLDNITRMMVETSDNTATNIMINAIGGIAAVNNEIRRLGYTKTTLNRYMRIPSQINAGLENYISAIEAADLIKNIYNNASTARDASDRSMLSKLSNNYYKLWLPASIQNLAQTWDKPGNDGTFGVENDVAIIKRNNRAYAIALLTQGTGSNGTTYTNRFAQLGQAIVRQL
uniref:GBS Bsp-like repeat-containing protein n=1 Tax=Streptococcus pluranimalium TaxID=82348 RepID=UPI003F690085